LARYANDIEADLLFKNIDIFDWYQGKMSSRRLLVLIERLPEKGAFKTAIRDGEWTLQEQLLTAVFNQIHAMRGDAYGEGFLFRPILSPSMQRQKDDELAAARAAHDDVIAQLRGEKQHRP
jgi:hypothetical protein